MSNSEEAAEASEVITEPIVLVRGGAALGSIFGRLDPTTIASCDADGVCN